jgi:hypothetical protein
MGASSPWNRIHKRSARELLEISIPKSKFESAGREAILITDPIEALSYNCGFRRSFNSQWLRDGEVIAFIQVRTESDCVRLSYRHRRYDEAWQSEDYPVSVEWTLRLKDPNNYYIVRANAVENNYRLYHMVNGRRRQFAGATFKVSSGDWHELRVELVGKKITCYYDGAKKIEATDDTSRMPAKLACGQKPIRSLISTT